MPLSPNVLYIFSFHEETYLSNMRSLVSLYVGNCLGHPQAGCAWLGGWGGAAGGQRMAPESGTGGWVWAQDHQGGDSTGPVPNAEPLSTPCISLRPVPVLQVREQPPECEGKSEALPCGLPESQVHLLYCPTTMVPSSADYNPQCDLGTGWTVLCAR